MSPAEENSLSAATLDLAIIRSELQFLCNWNLAILCLYTLMLNDDIDVTV